MTSAELRLAVDIKGATEIELATDGVSLEFAAISEESRAALVVLTHHAEPLVALYEACVANVESMPPDAIAAIARIMAVRCPVDVQRLLYLKGSRQ